MSGARETALSPQARRILVVDDNRDGAETLAMILRFAGHEVQVAFSGKEALALGVEQKSNVILLDLAMPGMDGYTVAQTLRTQPETRDALLIAVTGFGTPGDRAKSLAAGFHLHLLKPVEKEQLLEAVQGKAVQRHEGLVQLGELVASASWSNEKILSIRFSTQSFNHAQWNALTQLQHCADPIVLILEGAGIRSDCRIVGHEHDSSSVTFHVIRE